MADFSHLNTPHDMSFLFRAFFDPPIWSPGFKFNGSSIYRSQQCRSIFLIDITGYRVFHAFAILSTVTSKGSGSRPRVSARSEEETAVSERLMASKAVAMVVAASPEP